MDVWQLKLRGHPNKKEDAVLSVKDSNYRDKYRNNLHNGNPYAKTVLIFRRGPGFLEVVSAPLYHVISIDEDDFLAGCEVCINLGDKLSLPENL